MVGMRGFEPPAPCSRSKCATRLRYIPNNAPISVNLVHAKIAHRENSSLTVTGSSCYLNTVY